jgi:hypothetical protein
MKTPKLLLSIITLLVIVSCSTKEESVFTEEVVTEEVVPEEQDQFFITITENAQTLSIKASSYTESQQYEFVKQTAFQNEEEVGAYYPASIFGITIYEIENICALRASSEMSMWAHDRLVANFTIGIESSNEKEMMSNDDITRELFQMQNNVYHPVDLGEQEDGLDLLKENFDLAQINISYSLNDHTYKSFRYYDDYSHLADAYKQPAGSFFNVISVTEKQHRLEDSSSSIFNYDYVIEGNGKVRVFNEHDPENDYKDLEFTFKIPSNKLVPLKF